MWIRRSMIVLARLAAVRSALWGRALGLDSGAAGGLYRRGGAGGFGGLGLVGGRKFMSPEVVARILKGTLRPGPRDVHTDTATLTPGQDRRVRSSRLRLRVIRLPSSLTAGRRPVTVLLLLGLPVRSGHLPSSRVHHFVFR